MTSQGQNLFKFMNHNLPSYCQTRYIRQIYGHPSVVKKWSKNQLRFIHVGSINWIQNDDTSKQQTQTSQSERFRQSYERKRASQQSETIQPSIRANMNHYDRLNVDSESDAATIKSAYYALSKRYHPDIVGSKDQAMIETFRLITESYDVLSNPDSRSEYDSTLNKSELMDIVRGAQFNEGNIKPLYKTRDADMIFRQRQNAALEKEKLANPKKFQAGSFERTFGQDMKLLKDDDERDKRLSQYRSDLLFKVHSNSCTDGSDYYRFHLAHSMERRRFESQEMSRLVYKKHPDTKEGATILLLLLAGIVVTVLGIFVGFDLPDYLDRRLLNHGKQERQKE